MPEPRYVRDRRVLWRRTADGIVVRRRERQPGTISGTGEVLWDLLEEPRTLTALADELSHVYSASADQIARDIAPVLDELTAVGIVSIVSDAPADGEPT